MTMLIDLGYFDVIQLNYLVVGHTHCPIDQKLGAIATIIRQQDFIATPEALIHLLTVENKEKKPGIEGIDCNISLFTLLIITFCHKGTAFQQYSGRLTSFMMSRRHLTRTRTRRSNILKFHTNCCSSVIGKPGDATWLTQSSAMSRCSPPSQSLMTLKSSSQSTASLWSLIVWWEGWQNFWGILGSHKKFLLCLRHNLRHWPHTIFLIAKGCSLVCSTMSSRWKRKGLLLFRCCCCCCVVVSFKPSNFVLLHA